MFVLPPSLRRWLPGVVIALCVALYLGMATGPWADQVRKARHARDFASYYYAVQVALDGQDPYDTSLLDARAREDQTRAQVFPFFYPPPFLAAFAWVAPLSLEKAYRTWYFVDHLLLLGIALALWRWVRRPATLVLMALMAVSYSPLPDNDWMGQVNLLILLLSLLGLLAAERGREVLGGLLLGTACMLKMSPALLVLWWLLRGRFKPAIWACLGGLLLSLLTLPIVGPDLQWSFYTQILPGFGAGDYHGLSVSILLPANHSVPSLWAELFPGGRTELSSAALWASRVTALLLLSGLAWRFWRSPARDPLGLLCEVGAVIVVMLILPVYTYEHHTVWLLVPYTAAALSLLEGRLSRPWAIVLILAYLAQATPLAWLKELYELTKSLGILERPVYLFLREGKFLAEILVASACVVTAGRAIAPVQNPTPESP